MTNKQAKNTFRPKPAEKPLKKKRSFRAFRVLNQKAKVGSSLHSIVDGTFLTRQNLLTQVRFLLFITFIGVLYIANAYNAEKTIIEISRTKRQLEELRFEYISTKSKMMFHSKQSEVAYKLKNSGVKESVTPPSVIKVKE